jgi:hypothetical protein
VNEFFQQLFDQSKAAWQRFSASQRAIVVAVPLLLLVGLCYLLVTGA